MSTTTKLSAVLSKGWKYRRVMLRDPGTDLLMDLLMVEERRVKDEKVMVLIGYWAHNETENAMESGALTDLLKGDDMPVMIEDVASKTLTPLTAYHLDAKTAGNRVVVVLDTKAS